ncbi:uncharacterized protein [Choristoneura fumiferana]|uniref:uncharacterized protein n=1 Tax=Choristoneura fumiferana TaxID=7141 RepID=UPI003D15880A
MAAFTPLTEIFSTIPEEIVRKLHNLKAQFSQEVTKLKKKKSGSGTNEIYVSHWRYFKALSFLLQGKEYQGNTTDTLTDPSTPAEQQRAESQLSSVSDGQQPSSSNLNNNLPNPPSKKRKEDTSLLNKCAQIINQPNDDDQIFADYVASELRKLSKEGNKKLRRIIQRAIINIQDEEDGLVPPAPPSENTSSGNNCFH